MYELIQVSARDYYIQCPAKIGLVADGDGGAVLIDSGSDKDAGKKALRHLAEKGWTLKAILNTHSHADHIGGNAFLQEKTGCRVYAPGIECDFTNHPVLEPSLLYGGFPPPELRHKFLMGKESAAEPLTADALPSGMEILPLPGHSFDMVGFRTADDTVYLADCLSSAETLQKYGIGYLWDVKAYLETLERVKTMEAKRFVPSHAEAMENIAPLAQLNIDKTLEAADRIAAACAEPTGFEEILRRVFCEYNLTMTFQQHALVGSAVRSYLTWLKDTGRVEAIFDDNRLLWRKIG